MSSLCRSTTLALLFLSCTMLFAQAPLRVCADPDNLPFSSAWQQGFDNRIATLLGNHLHRPVVFVWARARRGFLRERFNQGACDVLMGAPEGMKHLRMTVPYYRSSYLFVTRTRDRLELTRFDDPAIGKQRIGLQILEDDLSPPSLPLIRTGHAAQLVGFDSFGDGGQRIIEAVASKQIGFAVVWGPLAGYYAHRAKVPLTLTRVQPSVDRSGIPFSFAIGIAVHSKDAALATQLDEAIIKNKAAIEAILRRYHVPVERSEGGTL